MMRTFFVFIFISLFTLQPYAQESGKEASNPYIEIYGTAEKEIIPNQIFISVTLKEKSKSRDSESLESQTAKLKEKLTEIGIPEELISMSDAGANYIKVSWSQKDVISSANFTIMVATANDVASVFQIFDELDIHGAYIKNTSHSDITFLRKKVRILAIKAAKMKAEYLLEAIDSKLGEPQIVRETSPAGVGMMTSNVVMNEPRQAYQSKLGGTIQFKKIKIQSTIFVRFGIE